MFDWSSDTERSLEETHTRQGQGAEQSALVEALHRSQGIIEFEPDGTILTANDNFLDVVEFDLGEIKGRHHRIFVEDEYARSEEYQRFWDRLAAGEYYSDRVKRVTKSGHEVFLQATYNPVLGENGEVQKVVKVAGNVTEQVRNERLAHQVDRMLEAIDRFSDGDLTARVRTDESDADTDEEIQRLFDGFNQSVGNLRQMMRQIREAAESTVSAAGRICASTDQMAASAEEQSAQAEEVAAAVEELNQTISENTEAVQQVAEAAEEGSRQARQGREVVSETTTKIETVAAGAEDTAEAIGRLGTYREEISQVVERVDEIASQTNLLALNAAIEAARAGEEGDGRTGQGFGVVAEEIRDLAEETDEATTEIEEIMGEVQEEIEEAISVAESNSQQAEEGLQMTQDTSEALIEIAASIEKVEAKTDEIAAASEQQSATSEQIAQNVQSISTATQESAQNVTEVSDTAAEMENLANRLQKSLKQFHLDDAATDTLQEEDRPQTGRREASGTGAETDRPPQAEAPGPKDNRGDGQPVGP